MSETGKGVRRQRTRGEVTAILEEFDRSGLSAVRFAADRGLSLSTFRWWLRRRRDEQVTRGPRLVPVRLAASRTTATTGSSTVEIVLANGRCLRVAPGVDPAALAELLVVVDGPC